MILEHNHNIGLLEIIWKEQKSFSGPGILSVRYMIKKKLAGDLNQSINQSNGEAHCVEASVRLNMLKCSVFSCHLIFADIWLCHWIMSCSIFNIADYFSLRKDCLSGPGWVISKLCFLGGISECHSINFNPSQTWWSSKHAGNPSRQASSLRAARVWDTCNMPPVLSYQQLQSCLLSSDTSMETDSFSLPFNRHKETRVFFVSSPSSQPCHLLSLGVTMTAQTVLSGHFLLLCNGDPKRNSISGW